MIQCGVDNDVLFNELTQAQRIARDVFYNSFDTCMDKTYEELDADFKAYSDLTQAQGQIRLVPGIRNCIKAFIQWTRDEKRLSRDPSSMPFPVENTQTLIRRYKTHAQFVKSSKEMMDQAKPVLFSSTTKWSDWQVTFANYLRLIPGRDGVPLNYVIRDNEQPDPTPHANFIDDYVSMAPLNGEAYVTDTATVHTLISKFIAGNELAESKVQVLISRLDGRLDWKALKEHYEGIGILALDVTRAEKIIENLFYMGERQPHMWWAEFEKQLTNAFTAYDKKERRQVYSNEMKLRVLLKKIKADFLSSTKSQIEVAFTEVPMTMTYERAMASFRNVVNQQHPPQLGATSSGRSRRGVSQIRTQDDKTHDTVDFNWIRRNKNRHKDETTIYLKDGKKAPYHPSYRYSFKLLRRFKDSDKKRLEDQRAQYKRERGLPNNKSSLSETQTVVTNQQVEIATLRAQVATLARAASTDDASVSPSALTTPTSIMGGRNEQSQIRKDRSVGQIIVKTISQTSTDTQSFKSTPGSTARNECDTNADTGVAGANMALISMSTRCADVYPYSDTYAPMTNIPIGSFGTAYEHPDLGTIILVYHEYLGYGTKMDHSLHNPNQLRHYGCEVQDNPFDPRGLYITTPDGITIPLETRGTKIFMNSRTPSPWELQHCTHITMTDANPWNPNTIQLQQITTLDFPIPSSLHDMGTSIESRIHLKAIATNESLQDTPLNRTFVSLDRHSNITAESLSEKWGIGPGRAKATLRVTTQRGTRSAILPLARRYKADGYFGVTRLRGKFYTDTLYGPCRSLLGNIGTQIYFHKSGFKAPYHLSRSNGEQIGHSLRDFIHEYGIPNKLTFDGAQAQVGRNTLFMKTIRDARIHYHVSQPRRPNENAAEGAIREIKKRWYRLQDKKAIPNRLWDFGLSWICETENLTANSSKYADGRTSIEIITGETPDITEHLDFGFYDWIYFRQNAGLGPTELGRWLGVSHRVGPQLSYWILPSSGFPISCVTVQAVPFLTQQTNVFQTQAQEYTDAVSRRINAQAADIPLQGIQPAKLLDLTLEDDHFLEEYRRLISDGDLPHQEHIDQMSTHDDEYIGRRIAIRRGPDNILEQGSVKKRALDSTGKPLGKPHDEAKYDSRQYKIKYESGFTETLTANLVAENLLTQIDKDGHHHLMLSGDH